MKINDFSMIFFHGLPTEIMISWGTVELEASTVLTSLVSRWRRRRHVFRKGETTLIYDEWYFYLVGGD